MRATLGVGVDWPHGPRPTLFCLMAAYSRHQGLASG